ncbi:hypothetical protein GCM10020216_041630 [Nonomuraea helvata]
MSETCGRAATKSPFTAPSSWQEGAALVNEQSDLRWAEGTRAFPLEEGVGYVRAWAEAQHAATG